MPNEFFNFKMIKIIRQKKNDMAFRGENHLVYQDYKIKKLKDTQTRYDENFEYIKPKSLNYRFWDGFIGWRYLFKSFD